MAVHDLERIEQRLDRTIAGAVTVSDNIGGVMFQNMAEVMEFSKLLSLAGAAVPKHLRGNPGACLAVTIQALEWRMSPVAVANKSYEVNDRIAYESQLVHAVVEARAPLKERLRARYEGEGQQRCCIVRGHFKGEVDPLEYRSPTVEKIKVKNSPLWSSDTDQQLFYYATRAWARRYCPDVLLGIYSEEELREMEPAMDVTPRPSISERLKGSKGRGFAHDNVDRALEHKPEQPLNTAPAAKPDHPEKSEAEVPATIEQGEITQAEDVIAEVDNELFLKAQEMTVRFIEGLPEMQTEEDLTEFKARAQDAIKAADISEEQKTALLGRFNTAFLERQRSQKPKKVRA